MRIVCGGVVAVLVAGLTLAMAQAPVGAAPANAAAAMGRPVAGSPGQAGRQALYKYLDDIAAKDEAARRAEIAKITDARAGGGAAAGGAVEDSGVDGGRV